MNREIYFKQLRKIIRVLPEDELVRILAFYQEIVADKIENGVSEEQAIAELGDVYSLGQKILMENPNRRPTNWGRIAAISMICVLGVFLVISVITTAVFFTNNSVPATKANNTVVKNSISEAMDDVQSDIDKAQKVVPAGAQRKTESISSKEIQQITLDTEKKYVIFKNADIAEIQVTYDTNSMQDYEINSQNKILTIRNRLKDRNHRRNWSGDILGNPEKYYIIITLPNGYSGNISLQGDGGCVAAENVNGLNKFSCQTDASAVFMNHVQAVQIQVDSDAGAVKLDNVEASDSVSLQTDVGAITFKSLLSPNITLDTDVGAVTGSIRGKEEEYKIHKEIDMGACNLQEKNSGLKSLNVKTDVGAVKITFEE